jgi:phage shock protein A
MGILSRMKQVLSSKGSGGLDKTGDPEKQLEALIQELEEQNRLGLQELVGYKATEKQLAAEAQRVEEKVASWEKRAMEAVRAGDDALAVEALREKKRCEGEALRIRHDRDEAASYAIELNRSRKQVVHRLAMLKLKKGTLAQQLAAARSGGDSPLSTQGALWDTLQRAEEKIEEESIATEVDAMLRSEEAGLPLESEAKLRQAAVQVEGDAALAALKAKMLADKEKKKLPPK